MKIKVEWLTLRVYNEVKEEGASGAAGAIWENLKEKEGTMKIIEEI